MNHWHYFFLKLILQKYKFALKTIAYRMSQFETHQMMSKTKIIRSNFKKSILKLKTKVDEPVTWTNSMS